MEQTVYYTVEDLVNILRFSPNKIREMLAQGEITGYKILNEWRVDPSELRAYIQSKSNQAKKKEE